MRLCFDFETNGLLNRPDLKLLCGAAVDVDTGEEFIAVPEEHYARVTGEEGFDYVKCPSLHNTLTAYTIEGFIKLLCSADELIGHNIAGFDLPLIDRFGGDDVQYTDRILDTLAWSRQAYFNDLLARTAKFRNAAGPSEEARDARFPKRFLNPMGMHGLRAWGYRLGNQKGDFLEENGVQEEYSDELLDYCLQDVHVNAQLWRHQQTDSAEPGWPITDYEAMVVESRVMYLTGLQERNGVGFNEPAAAELYAALAGRRDELVTELRRDYFPDWWAGEANQKGCPVDVELVTPLVIKHADASYTVPRRTYSVGYPNALAGRQLGCPFTKIELREFTGSRHQIADRLQRLYGWKPKAFGKDGTPTVDETVLAGLSYPCMKPLLEMLLVKKRLGQIGDGKEAWLKHSRDGKIHGRVSVTGARTSRMSHSKPNLAQVPKVKSPYGVECRGLFGPTTERFVMVGADASGIELRMLGHRLAQWDGGAFWRSLLEGDPHSDWMRSTGIFIRDNQKTCTYAMLYGAQDPKLGEIRLDDWREAYDKGLTTERPPARKFGKALGGQIRDSLLLNVAGLDELYRVLRRKFKQGFLVGIDGRVIKVPAEHGALNDLLQSDAGITMKHALVIFADMLNAAGITHGWHYEWLLNVHDEWQLGCLPELGEVIGKMACEAIRLAGEKLGVRCPLAGEFKIGRNWAETH